VKNFLFVSVFGVLAIASCQKSTNDVPATPSKVSMTIYSPTNGTSLRLGDTLRLNAAVSYISELHGYAISMTDSATGSVVWTKEAHVHDDQFTIAEHWVDTLSRPATLRLNLSVEIDHDGNEADTTLRILNR
jgi:hypothetical protein